jgi:hypothetical protein
VEKLGIGLGAHSEGVVRVKLLGRQKQYAARKYYVSVHRVQTEELYGHQEQEDHDGADRTKKVLSVLPQTSSAQRN